MNYTNSRFPNSQYWQLDRSASRAQWITLADLMALLLTFFIVLLAASSFDTKKFDAITDSMEKVFGSDKQVSKDIVNVKPQPPMDPEREIKNVIKPIVVQPAIAQRLRDSLVSEMTLGLVELELDEGEVIIRFPETATFDSGDDILKPQLHEVMAKVARVLDDTEGEIRVNGHADDQPINTMRFRSNWDLSAARAASVVHALTNETGLDPKRMVVQGFGDNRPVKKNDSPANRLQNRRVEIIVSANRPTQQTTATMPIPTMDESGEVGPVLPQIGLNPL